MAAKNNIRSIRFTDELAELIDRQQGDTFTQKFENLITRCVWELPEKENQLKLLEIRIEEKRGQLRTMADQLADLRTTINILAPSIKKLEGEINWALEKWSV